MLRSDLHKHWGGKDLLRIDHWGSDETRIPAPLIRRPPFRSYWKYVIANRAWLNSSLLSILDRGKDTCLSIPTGVWWRLVEIFTISSIHGLWGSGIWEKGWGWSVSCPQLSCFDCVRASLLLLLHFGVWRLKKRHFIKRINILKQLRWCMWKRTLYCTVRDFYYFPTVIIKNRICIHRKAGQW